MLIAIGHPDRKRSCAQCLVLGTVRSKWAAGVRWNVTSDAADVTV